MSVFVIRKHQRFAVVRKAVLMHDGEGHNSTRKIQGIVIELSLDGARIGNVDSYQFRSGDEVTVAIKDAEPFSGHVRWQGDGTIGLKLERPFHANELDGLLRLCRGEYHEDGALRAMGG